MSWMVRKSSAATSSGGSRPDRLTSIGVSGSAERGENLGREPVLPKAPFGMPLDSQRERGSLDPDGLDQTVGCCRLDREAGCQPVDPLAMNRVHQRHGSTQELR